ncbi:MAG: YceI family protein [Pseudomonadota bacterium]|nr:YceI family protein [Pseudomonadota bacterium]
MKSKLLISIVLTTALAAPSLLQAADYVIDTEKAHAFIQFRIKHLGYSWLLGRFNDFDGTFSYDEANPAASRVEVTIRTASIDSNHAERDKHLRGKEFLEVDKFPEATFVSTGFTQNDDKTAVLSGNLTLHGVTRPVSIAVKQIGHGPDPWGGKRRGFEATTRLKLADYNIDFDLGPAAREVELFLSVEGIEQ